MERLAGFGGEEDSSSLLATHLKYRVSDFGLSWRGHQDAVVEGYEEVSPLSELEQSLLTPAYLSWLFVGIEGRIRAMLAGRLPYDDFAWTVRHLLRRPTLYGQRLPPYRAP